MTQKFPINILTAPSATADGTKLAVDFYGDTVRLDTDTFTPAPPPPVVAYGTGGGFWVGGTNASGGSTDTIAKINWASDTSVLDVGQFNPGPALPGVSPTIPGAWEMSIVNSSTDAYAISGRYFSPSTGPLALPGTRKFPLSSTIGSVNTASFPSPQLAGCATGRSPEAGYAAGGYQQSPFVIYNSTYKLTFSSDTGSYAGNINSGPRYFGAGVSSSESFYALGGGTTPFAVTNSMDKWPFANDSSSAHPGTFGTSAQQFATLNAPDAGFASHGRYYPGSSDPSGFGWWNNLERLPFASDTTTVDVGQIATAGYSSTGNGSDSNGYVLGVNVDRTQMEKFPFASTYPVTDYATNPYGSVGAGSATGATFN